MPRAGEECHFLINVWTSYIATCPMEETLCFKLFFLCLKIEIHTWSRGGWQKERKGGKRIFYVDKTVCVDANDGKKQNKEVWMVVLNFYFQ